MIKFLIIVFVGLSLIPAIPFVYGKYVEWDVGSAEFDNSFVNLVLDSATPASPVGTAKQAKDVNPTVGLVDIRDERAFQRKHLKNAVNIPQGKLEEVMDDMFPDKNTVVYVYDDSGDSSASVAVRYLRQEWQNLKPG